MHTLRAMVIVVCAFGATLVPGSAAAQSAVPGPCGHCNFTTTEMLGAFQLTIQQP